MLPETRFAILASCIYLPLGLGYVARKLMLLQPEVSKRISRTTLLTLEPITVLVGCWLLGIPSVGGAAVVPVVGALVSLGLLAMAAMGATLLGLRGARRGAYLNCGMMSNIGMSLGGFICYQFLGVQGQGLSVLYTAHFIPVCFTMGVVLASHYGQAEKATVGATLRGVAKNPVVLAPLSGLVVGLSLNALGVWVPAWVRPVNAVAVFGVVSLHSFAIGLTLRVSRVRHYWREILGLAATKFLFGPLSAAGVVLLLGQWGAYGGLMWRVAVIEGAMPVAIFATVVSNLFDLDRDLANSSWVVTTLACAAVIPALYLVTAL
ncbi:MAG TPA: hypothetical protein PLE19_23265 [Planctomycetota bacterium]|nr:hypothetical protein [Planctomycetota bacterium]HRR80281.1 hypothetical protein [Planctomycetota bacterium]HRT95923.1 hypothetical protein [Planctomycetota bacterium]